MRRATWVFQLAYLMAFIYIYKSHLPAMESTLTNHGDESSLPSMPAGDGQERET
jgi:hypothetical protein